MFNTRICLTLAVVVSLTTTCNMAQAVVVWGPEHEAKARVLARPGEEVLQLDKNKAGKLKAGDTTLTVWGHGDSRRNDFCGLTSAQFAIYVLKWKRANPQLKTVEIITCDTQHADGSMTSYANRVVKLGEYRTMADIKFKVLPIGIKNGYSILVVEDRKKIFTYVTADTKATLDKAYDVLKRAVGQGLNLHEATKRLARAPQYKKVLMTMGKVTDLRKYLEPARPH
jgi:hypothetical protein